MTLNLNEPEQEFLLEILQDRLGSLREQVYHSTTSTFTETLKDREKLLKGLIDRLQTSAD